MTTLSCTQVAALVKKVGFPSSLHVTFVAIAKAESGNRVEVVNSIGCVGLFQINAPVHKQFDRRRLATAEYNVRAALSIYKSQGIRAWEAYTNGAYKRYLSEARQGVARASDVNAGSVTMPTGDADTDELEAITYGPKGPQITKAGSARAYKAQADLGPLADLRIRGKTAKVMVQSIITGSPMFETGIETVPNVKFSLVDPDGGLLWDGKKHGWLWQQGASVEYRDMRLRIDTATFVPGSHGTGQIDIVAIDDIVYRLMRLRGARTASNISATEWIAQELRLVGLNPNHMFLGQSVPSQSVIARDEDDQEGESSPGQQPSSWTTMVRLARELGKRLFVSGHRLVFGSSAFAMHWCGTSGLRLGWNNVAIKERFLTLPTAENVSVGDRQALKLSGRIPMNRAIYFRPGRRAWVTGVPMVMGFTARHLMVASLSHSLGSDVDGAEITLIRPIDPPPEPPEAPNDNTGSTSGLAGISGGGADGQIARFVNLALSQIGDTYVFGAEASPSDPNPSRFDCSELVEWAAARAGISPRVPDGSSAQIAHCKSISVAQAIKTKGALLWSPGHIAISLGNGTTVEAMNPSAGVRKGRAAGRFSRGGLIPGAKGYR